MVGHADIPHHLVELVSLHDRERILLRLDLAALERVVDLIGWRCDRLRPECRKSVKDHLPWWNADLHPGEIVRFRDRAVDGRDLSHAVIEAGNKEKIHGNLEQYPLSVISGLAEQTVVSTRAKVDPRSGPF